MKIIYAILVFLTGVCLAQTKDSLYAEFSGDTVKIWNTTALNCCSSISFEVEIKDKHIVLTEVDTAKTLCKCLCLFNLCADLTGLEAGNYTIDIYRKIPPSSAPDSLIYVGTINLEMFSGVHSSSNSRVSLLSYQSKCLHEIQNNALIYSNSFEAPSDTIGWEGYMELHEDAAPEGGRFSAFISGGCIWPHAWVELPALEEDGYFTIRCWGKDLQIGGSVAIRVEDDFSKEASIFINKPEWTYHESDDSLFCPAGKKIFLYMGSGGIAPSAMLIDRLEILRIESSQMPTNISDEKEIIVSSFQLFQNYPNPFNPSTKIKYAIPAIDTYNGLVSKVELKVYDVLGNVISTLVDKEQSPGNYEVEFDGHNVSSGIYFYTLNVGDKRQIRKMSLIK